MATKELRLPPRESIPFDRHPLNTRRYTVPTPMILALVAIISAWIKNGITGAYIEGDPRRGKTKARRLICVLLQKIFPRLPVFSMIARLYVHPSERVFFGDLLRAFKHSLYSEGTAAQRRDRLVEGIVNAAQSAGQEKVVLLIDQAHRLMELHYDWLVDLHDELSERGIELFVFLFGQKELSTIAEELKRAGKTQILGRFLVDHVQFFGIRTKKDLKLCLTCYDESCRFPEDTDWTFTRYCLPQLFERGWRLADLTEAFWKAFEDVHRRSSARSRLEIPMQHFVRTVERLLIEFEGGAKGEAVVTHQKLAGFVADTGFGSIARGDAPIPDADEEEEEENGDA